MRNETKWKMRYGHDRLGKSGNSILERGWAVYYYHQIIGEGIEKQREPEQRSVKWHYPKLSSR